MQRPNFLLAWEITVSCWKKLNWILEFIFFLTENDSISKSYYLSQSYSEPISKSHQICESFNMILAAPQDQSEYDNLKKLSKKLNVDDFEAAISGYRSKLNDRLWLINGKEVNFVIDWFDGEPKPNKPYSDEHCYGNQRNV